MFERFTERAGHVVVLAQDEARLLKHDHIASEHLLLGLVREQEGLAARVLERLDLTLEGARAQVVGVVGSGEEAPSGQLPFTSRAKKVLDISWREALSLGHSYVGTEHLLLALARDWDGVVARILLEAGASAEMIRSKVTRFLAGPRRHSTGRLDLDAVLDGGRPLLDTLAGEIERRLGRSPDTGDLLVALASIPGGLVARTLASLSIDIDGLARAFEEARAGGQRTALGPPGELLAQIEETRDQKEALIWVRAYERAAEMRDRERELRQQARRDVEQRQEKVLGEVRARLGIAYER